MNVKYYGTQTKPFMLWAMANSGKPILVCSLAYTVVNKSEKAIKGIKSSCLVLNIKASQ